MSLIIRLDTLLYLAGNPTCGVPEHSQYPFHIITCIYQHKQQQNWKVFVQPIIAANSAQIVKVRESSFQQKRAELQEEVKIDTTPEKLTKSALRQVQVAEEKAF